MSSLDQLSYDDRAALLLPLLPYRVKALPSSECFRWLTGGSVLFKLTADGDIAVADDSKDGAWSMQRDDRDPTRDGRAVFTFFFKDELKAVEFKLRFG